MVMSGNGGAGGAYLPAVEMSYDRTHELSKGILGYLAGQRAEVGYGALACALTIGRLMSPEKPLEIEQEEEFLQGVMDFCGAFFHEGVKH